MNENIRHMGESDDSPQDEDSQVVRSSSGIQINRRGKPLSGKGNVDVVFVIDTTGSMADKIDGLLHTCQKFVDEINSRDIDWQIAIVGFGDLTVEGDKIVATGFSRDVEVVKKSLGNIPRYFGGGNEGESSLEALDRAMRLLGYRSGVMKVFLFLTDEPALVHELSPDHIIHRLEDDGILTFVISVSEQYYKDMASRTGGEWFEIESGTDFLSVLDRIIKDIGKTVSAVQLEAGGDVKAYLQLNSGGG